MIAFITTRLMYLRERIIPISHIRDLVALSIVVLFAGVGGLACSKMELPTASGPYEVIEGNAYVIRIPPLLNAVTGAERYHTLLTSAEITSPVLSQRYVFVCESDNIATGSCLRVDLKDQSITNLIPGSVGRTKVVSGNISWNAWREKKNLWHQVVPEGKHLLIDIATPANDYTVICSASYKERTQRSYSLWGDSSPGFRASTRYTGYIYIELFDCKTLKRMALLRRPFVDSAGSPDINETGYWDDDGRIFVSEDSWIDTDEIILLDPRID